MNCFFALKYFSLKSITLTLLNLKRMAVALQKSRTETSLRTKAVSCVGFLVCLSILIGLIVVFKEHLMQLLTYMENKSRTNMVESQLLMLLLFACVSLPIFWGYSACMFTCGFIYSFLYGFLLVVFYSTIGMSFSFFVCRYALHNWAQNHVNQLAYLKAISSIIESDEKGVRVIFLTRLIPIPFGIANAMFSVTNVKFYKYIVSSIVGIMPVQLIFCYMGSTVKSMKDAMVSGSTVRTASFVFILQISLAICIMYYVLNTAKKELDKHLNAMTDVV